jgi:hypothetical protein
MKYCASKLIILSSQQSLLKQMKRKEIFACAFNKLGKGDKRKVFSAFCSLRREKKSFANPSAKKPQEKHSAKNALPVA